jgi:hypothetical protein
MGWSGCGKTIVRVMRGSNFAPAVRLDVVKLSLMLSSDPSQIGTGSSNSPRSASESCFLRILRPSAANESLFPGLIRLTRPNGPRVGRRHRRAFTLKQSYSLDGMAPRPRYSVQSWFTLPLLPG